MQRLICTALAGGLLFACSEKQAKEASVTPVVAEAPTTPEADQPEAQPPTEAAPAEESAPIAPKDFVPEVVPVPKSLRFVLVSNEEPLGSETRMLNKLQKSLAAGRSLDEAAVTDEEKSFFASLGQGTALPANWASIETVVMVGVADPEVTAKGKRVSRGLSGVAIFMPPQLEPMYVERMPAGSVVGTQGVAKIVDEVLKEAMRD